MCVSLVCGRLTADRQVKQVCSSSSSSSNMTPAHHFSPPTTKAQLGPTDSCTSFTYRCGSPSSASAASSSLFNVPPARSCFLQKAVSCAGEPTLTALPLSQTLPDTLLGLCFNSIAAPAAASPSIRQSIRASEQRRRQHTGGAPAGRLWRWHRAGSVSA